MENLIKTKEEKEQVLKWLEALRSGKYKQTTGTLQDENGFCCLGVACKILIPNDNLIVWGNSNMIKGTVPSHQPNSPRWLFNINTYFDKKGFGSITILNDIDKKNFNEIADFIEKKLKPQLDLIK